MGFTSNLACVGLLLVVPNLHWWNLFYFGIRGIAKLLAPSLISCFQLLSFCPTIALNRDVLPLFEVVGVWFLTNTAMVATYYQYSCPKLSLIMRHLTIFMIILFSLLAWPFCCGVRGNDLFHLIPCSFKYSCTSLLAYSPLLSVLKHLTFIPRPRSKAT